MGKIIFIGPESSGKTTLCKKISNHLKIPFNEEYARAYLEKTNGSYTKKDLLNIAKQQLIKEKKKILLDTDLISIKIWSEYKFKHCDKWIVEQIYKQKTEKRFYFLCKPDIPWESDPLRENPNNRDDLFAIYKKELNRLEHTYFIIDKERRFEKAILKISELSVTI